MPSLTGCVGVAPDVRARAGDGSQRPEVVAADGSLILEVARGVGDAAAALVGDDQDLPVCCGVGLMGQLEVVRVVGTARVAAAAGGDTCLGQAKFGRIVLVRTVPRSTQTGMKRGSWKVRLEPTLPP